MRSVLSHRVFEIVLWYIIQMLTIIVPQNFAEKKQT